jgi:hypothetical protein
MFAAANFSISYRRRRKLTDHRLRSVPLWSRRLAGNRENGTVTVLGNVRMVEADFRGSMHLEEDKQPFSSKLQANCQNA